jgi:hypothetical protein
MPVAMAFGPIKTRLAVRTAAILVVLAVWALGWVGAIAALTLRWRRLGGWLIAGVAIAGAAAAIFGTHPGLSQVYFLRSALPALGALAAVGLAELVRRCGARRGTWLVVAGSLLAGLAVALVVRAGSVAPTEFHGVPVTYPKLVAPYVVMVVVAAATGLVVAAVAGRSRRRGRRYGVMSFSLVVLVAVGMIQGAAFSEFTTDGLRPAPTPALGEGAPDGVDVPVAGAQAARWLRGHSATSDVIATNAHYLDWPRNKTPYNFWISALTERQVLIEGWAYSTPSAKVAPNFVETGPFWNRDFLAENDDAIYDPSPKTVAWLRAHSVRWVFVDREVGMEAPTLKGYLDLAYQNAQFAIYRVG